MRAQDIVKIANTNSFDIFKLNEINESHFCLKHLINEDLASWEVLSENSSFDDIMILYHKKKSQEKHSLLYWKEFSTFDILALIECGFQVWRETKDSNICLEVFDKKSLNWKLHKEFSSLQEKNVYLNKALLDQFTIVID